MTATVALSAATILAIDLGKYKSVACVYQPATAELQFQTFDSRRSEMQKLIEKHQPEVVAIEACALTGWVYDLCVALGVRCLVANTSSESWKFQHCKRKTDRDDAQRLAHLVALNQLPTVAVPAKPVREDRALVAARQRLVGRRVAVQNRLRALLVMEGLPAPFGAKAWSELGLSGLAAHAKPLAECAAGEIWRGLLDLALTEYRQVVALIADLERVLNARGQANPAVRLLQTIPGVGPRTAETIVAHLADPKRFASAKQVSAYAGLVPKQFQSGATDHRGRITRRGPGVLRKLLVECAWCTLRYNAWAKSVYQRLTRGGVTRKKPAIVALARRLLVVCWAMLRDGKAWRAPMPA
jgi:transposase